jgi:hypothetical protein
VFVHLQRLAAARPPAADRIAAPFAVMLGLLVFAAAYVLAFVTPEIAFSVAGLANRTAIGAAIGVALFVVGAAALAALRPQAAAGSHLFAGIVAIVCTAGVVITTATASHWVSAYATQQTIVADIRAHVPTLPGGSTLLLDGICPYDGPAVVFESNWYLAGALRIAYADPTLKADVVSPVLELTDQGITTLLYGHLFAEYPFTGTLAIYHRGRKTLTPLPTASDARAYFAPPHDRSNGCPAGVAGEGVRLY